MPHEAHFILAFSKPVVSSSFDDIGSKAQRFLIYALQAIL
jgi:hypothetical protein